jgi:hypothetical protein
MLNLNIITLNDNELEEVTGLDTYALRVERVEINRNKLLEIESILMIPSLKVLEASLNQVEEIEIGPEHGRRLEDLDLRDNPICGYEASELLEKIEDAFPALLIFNGQGIKAAESSIISEIVASPTGKPHEVDFDESLVAPAD